MTFDELLEKLSYDYLHPAKRPDGRIDADKNGHTRLADLQEKYNLSSLKVQKLLVTAGVYEPVKAGSSYYAVKQLRDAGKSVDEIMAELNISKAAVNAFLPYEKNIHNAEAFGGDISDEAERKRRQRNNEEMKKENARDILADTMSDEALWTAIGEHDNETFISTSGQRFHVSALRGVQGKRNGLDISYQLTVAILNKANKVQDIKMIPKEEVLDSFHAAIEFTAEEKADASPVDEEDAVVDEKEHIKNGDSGDGSISRRTNLLSRLGTYAEYLVPLFTRLGVIDGEKKSTTKRNDADERCSCCGRRTSELYKVSSFEDLINLDEYFEQKRVAAFTDEERQMAKAVDFMMAKEQKHWREREKEQIRKAKDSKAVGVFDAEGDRKLCDLCCKTIYSALKEGIWTPTLHTGGYDEIDDDELWSFIQEECSEADCDYFQAFRREIKAEELDNRGLFLYEAMDRKGNKHSFSLETSTQPHSNGDVGLLFRALEIHKLTKNKKIAAGSTDTDYDITHFRLCPEGEDVNHYALVGIVELIEKIIDVIRTETLTESHSPAGNLITINGHHYGIGSSGTITPTYVGYAENYQSMKDREWDGSEYGFMIDGKLFTGNEVVLMASCHEGAQVKFHSDDPASKPLTNDDFMMQVPLSQKSLMDETIDLINMFTTDGKFERDKDRENFSRLFEKYVMEKLKLYHESRPRGYGKLAGMELIKNLKWIDGTEKMIENIRKVIR